MTKAERSRNLRYKRPMLESLGWESIISELEEISEACSDVHWYFNDDDTLLNALDGDEDDTWEFKMAFSDLEASANILFNILRDIDIQDEFDDCTVALLGNRYKSLGYDDYEEDYYSLTSYECELATTESGKRLMRHTKPEMISLIGQCMGITLSFFDLQQKYDYLKATIDLLRDENTSILAVVKEIDQLYDDSEKDGFVSCGVSNSKFESLLQTLPDRIWVE